MPQVHAKSETGPLYFAYGSNLNQAHWQEWCKSQGYPSGLLRFRSTAFLPDHQVCFSHKSIRWGGGVLDVQPRPAHVVPGAVFEVADAGWKALDKKEGAPHCYRQVPVTVIGPQGKESEAVTYHVSDEIRRSFVQPTEEYLETVRDGCENFELGTDHICAAAKNEPSPGLVDAFFVYGTLMRGESRFPALQQCGIECALLAETRGRLLDLGSYPGLVDLYETTSLVQGDFIRVRHASKAVQCLDDIEGFPGFGQPEALYRRTLADIGMRDGRVRPAWTYYYAGGVETTTEVPSSDWREHCGRRDAFLAALVSAHSQGDERRVAEQIAIRVPFSFNLDAAQCLLPLKDALADGRLSERELAQGSGLWTALA